MLNLSILEIIGMFGLAVSGVELVLIVVLAVRVHDQHVTIIELRNRTTNDRDQIATLLAKHSEVEWKLHDAERDVSELQRDLTRSSEQCGDRIAQLAREVMVLRNSSTIVPVSANPEVAEAWGVASQLAARFSDDEMQLLAAEIGLRWDEIAGETLSVKALNLAEAMRLQRRIPALREAIQRARP